MWTYLPDCFWQPFEHQGQTYFVLPGDEQGAFLEFAKSRDVSVEPEGGFAGGAFISFRVHLNQTVTTSKLVSLLLKEWHERNGRNGADH